MLHGHQFLLNALRIDTGFEPRFALFSITAEVQKIEYCIIYHLKGVFFLYTMMYFPGNLRIIIILNLEI